MTRTSTVPTAIPRVDTARAPRSPRRRVVEFTGWCLAISWIPLIVLIALHGDIGEGGGRALFVLGTAGPSLAALVMTVLHRREVRRRTVRSSWRWPVAAVLLGAGPALLTAVLLHLGDLSAIPHAITTAVAGIGGPLMAIVYTFVAGPLAEEFGWRGYLQPRLRQFLRPAPAALLLGVGWALWHLPLFFLPGTGQHAMGLFSLGGLMFVVSIVAFAYVMLVVTERLGGGVPGAVLAHAAFNVSHDLMPALSPVGTVIESGLVVLSAVLLAAVRTVSRQRRSAPGSLVSR